MRMSTGIHRSRAPTESKPRSPARCPSWKIHTRAPKLAPRLRMFMMTALIGTMIEPVMRNSSTRVAATTRSAGEREPFAEPGLDVDELGGDAADLGVEGRLCVPRSSATSSDASRPCDVPAGVTSTTVTPAGVSGRMDVPTTPGVARELLEPGDELGAVGVGVGDDGDGVGAAGREPVGEGEGDRRGPPRSGAGCGRRRSRSGRRGTARRAGRARPRRRRRRRRRGPAPIG